MGSTLLLAGCGGGSSSGTGNSSTNCPVDAAAPSAKTAPPPSGSLLTPGTLTFGSDISYPPQEFFPDGCGGKSPDGFDLDVAKAVAAQSFERVYTLFPRLKERRKQLAGTLSGGEQQMLAMGRALMGAPKLRAWD